MSDIKQFSAALPAVEISDLHYRYPDGTQALKGINLEIYRGERLAFMGSNGSGKSTLFLCMNGVLRPEQGQIAVGGKPIDYSRKGLLEVRKQVGIVFQEPDNQLFSADVRQELSFGPLNLGYSQEETRAKVDAIVAQLDMEALQDKPTHFLSGGEKKRVAIGDILIMEPDIIILDEPDSALDPHQTEKIDGIIDSLTEKGTTVIISTHNMDRALKWADRIILLHEGKVAGQGRPEEVLKDKVLRELTNLKEPTVLRIYEALKAAGLLDEKAGLPRSIEDLEQLIRRV